MSPQTEISRASRFRVLGALGLRAMLGIGMGFLFHYLLYRFSLPAQPFIYVAF